MKFIIILLMFFLFPNLYALTVSDFSLNVENHQIVIRGNKKSGAMEDYYFSKGQANKLFEAISEAKLQKFKEALKAQKENEDSMFN